MKKSEKSFIPFLVPIACILFFTFIEHRPPMQAILFIASILFVYVLRLLFLRWNKFVASCIGALALIQSVNFICFETVPLKRLLITSACFFLFYVIFEYAVSRSKKHRNGEPSDDVLSNIDSKRDGQVTLYFAAISIIVLLLVLSHIGVKLWILLIIFVLFALIVFFLAQNYVIKSGDEVMAEISKIKEKARSQAGTDINQTVLLPLADKEKNVPVSEISGFNTSGGITTMYYTDGKSVVVGLTLKKLQEILPATFFVRLNKQWIINAHCVQSIRKSYLGESCITIIPDLDIELSYVSALRFYHAYEEFYSSMSRR